jgi:CRISPR-associated protein Cas5t
MPRIATTLRKLSRFKYGVSSHSGHLPDYVQTLCGIEFLIWVDSSAESRIAKDATSNDADSARNLEQRITEAITIPENVSRYGVLCLGLSDDAVNNISLCTTAKGAWHRLLPSNTGDIELPVLVQHVGSARTKWQRYLWEVSAVKSPNPPDGAVWRWTEMNYLQTV